MILCLHDFTDFWYGWRKQLRGLSGIFLVHTAERTLFGKAAMIQVLAYGAATL
jgi:hypothetical protein